VKVADPFAERASRAALIASAAIALAGVVGGAVRVLPWALDPAVPIAVIAPFARGLLALALEAAIFVGWPLGWSLAAFAIVERGEALAIAGLGERPLRTVMRSGSRGVLFAGALAVASIAGGRDANEPGRVINELLAKSRSACANAAAPMTYAVPFANVTWICAPGSSPRLFGHGALSIGALHDATFTASNAALAGDLRSIDLEDANVTLHNASLHVGALALRGLPPWARASSLPPSLRAIFLVASSAFAALLAALFVLARSHLSDDASSSSRRFRAIAIGIAGPLAALATLRILERTALHAAWFALVPIASVASTCAVASIAALVSHLNANRVQTNS
jgi:hypothetical protein